MALFGSVHCLLVVKMPTAPRRRLSAARIGTSEPSWLPASWRATCLGPGQGGAARRRIRDAVRGAIKGMTPF